MISQEEVALNRILFATKGILTLIVVCCILTFDHIELKNLRSNSKILHFLSQVDKTEDTYFTYENFELLRIKWLKENSNIVYNRHVQSRTSMIQMLKSKIRILDGGGNERQIGYEDKGGGETESYNELTIGESTNRIVLMNKLTSTYNESKRLNSTSDPISSHVVDSSISRFINLSNLDTVEVLISIDTILLNTVFHTLVSQTSKIDSFSNQKYRRKTFENSQKSDDGNWGEGGNRNEHPSYPTDTSIKLNEIKLEGPRLFFEIKHKGSLPDFPNIVITEETHHSNKTAPNNYRTVRWS